MNWRTAVRGLAKGSKAGGKGAAHPGHHRGIPKQSLAGKRSEQPIKQESADTADNDQYAKPNKEYAPIPTGTSTSQVPVYGDDFNIIQIRYQLAF